MATGGQGFQQSFKAGADLNTTTSDFAAVRIGSSMSIQIANTSTHKAIGILQNRPKSGTGSSCWVQFGGVTKVTMNDTCSANDIIVTGSGGPVKGTGLSITAATSRFQIGYALEASAASGTVISLLLHPGTISGTLSAAID